MTTAAPRTLFILLSALASACATTGTKKPGEIPVGVDRDTQYRVAVHEAGHAVAAAILRPRYPVEAIVVRAAVADGEPFGTVNHARVKRLDTVGEIVDEVVEDLAGREAETLVVGEPSDGGTMDLANANVRIRDMCTKSGLCGSLLIEDPPSPAMLGTIRRCLDHARARAAALVAANASVIKDLAAVLMAQPEIDGKRMLSAAEFRSFLEGRALSRGARVAGSCP
jgi:ATP-dependent Zn protease